MRRRQHEVEQHLIKLMAHASSVDANAIRGAWGELKATALMTPQPTTRAGPIQPEFLIAVGRSIGLDISETGSDHHLLNVIIELARAPVPSNWEPMEADEEEEEVFLEADGRPPDRCFGTCTSDGRDDCGHPMTGQVKKLAMGIKAERQERRARTRAAD